MLRLWSPIQWWSYRERINLHEKWYFCKWKSQCILVSNQRWVQGANMWRSYFLPFHHYWGKKDRSSLHQIPNYWRSKLQYVLIICRTLLHGRSARTSQSPVIRATWFLHPPRPTWPASSQCACRATRSGIIPVSTATPCMPLPQSAPTWSFVR